MIYGCIFTACHFFCFARTKEAVTAPEKEKISLKVQLAAVVQNRPYILALLTGITMLVLYLFNVREYPIAFYAVSAVVQFFSPALIPLCTEGTAIYAIIPDCVEYGEWKTGLRKEKRDRNRFKITG